MCTFMENTPLLTAQKTKEKVLGSLREEVTCKQVRMIERSPNALGTSIYTDVNHKTQM